MEHPSIRLVLTGVLPFVVVVAAMLSLPLCMLLLRQYRRAVLAGMGTSAGAAPMPEREVPRSPPLTSLVVEDLSTDIATLPSDVDALALQRAAPGAWRVSTCSQPSPMPR
jgi:hypothetical protein